MLKKYFTHYSLCIVLIFLVQNIYSQCADNGNYWNESWISCTTSANPNPARGNGIWILYEFEELHYVDSTHIWNANRSGESGFGVKDVIIDYSEDGENWTELGEYTFPQAPETDDYVGFVGPDFEGVGAVKILFTVVNTHDGGDCASIAEIVIGIDEDACYSVMDECGVCDGPGKLIWYIDADGDGLGDINNSIYACEAPDGYVSDSTDMCDNGALGWEEIGPLFQENGCLGCHGNGAAGGLNLKNYNSTIAGGNTCGDALMTGDHFVQVITVSGYDECGFSFGPSMNDRSSGAFDDEELEQLQFWIDGGFPELCTDFVFPVDADGDGYYAGEDCDDDNADINPGVEEVVYNGIDDDCDPATLDDDLDQDGFVLADDCDDENADVHPGAEEVVYNGIDDDCDPATLDDDLDQDGFVLADDCDDENEDIHPGAEEVVYNGKDDDCDPTTLDDDLDQDGYVLADDCDDENADIHPGVMEEVYNGIDDDCDPATLDDDLDQDGFVLAEDCDDDNADVFPGAEEIPNNGIDEDCDGEDLVTSVMELAEATINVYPNPTLGNLYIDVEGPLNYRVIIYTINGQVMHEQSNTTVLSITDYPQGTYILMIQDIASGAQAIERIVKQ